MYLRRRCGQGERREEHQTQPPHLLGLVAALEQRQLQQLFGACGRKPAYSHTSARERHAWKLAARAACLCAGRLPQPSGAAVRCRWRATAVMCWVVAISFSPSSEPPSCGASPSNSRTTASRTLPLGSRSALLFAARASASASCSPCGSVGQRAAACCHSCHSSETARTRTSGLSDSPSRAWTCVENSRPEAWEDQPCSTPRQRQIKLRAAFSLGPAPAQPPANWQICFGWPAIQYRPCFPHRPVDRAEQRRGGAQQAQLTWHAAAQQPGHCRARGGGSGLCSLVECGMG